ncbi:hypothetical protein NKG05_06550 [Oerskovia sp. M15]
MTVGRTAGRVEPGASRCSPRTPASQPTGADRTSTPTCASTCSRPPSSTRWHRTLRTPQVSPPTSSGTPPPRGRARGRPRALTPTKENHP